MMRDEDADAYDEMQLPTMQPDSGSLMTEAVMDMLAMFGPIREATVRYRADLIADDFSETAAEAMCIDFHRHVIAVFTAGVQKSR